MQQSASWLGMILEAHTPLVSGRCDLEERVDHVAQTCRTWPTSCRGRRRQRRDQRPFAIAHIAAYFSPFRSCWRRVSSVKAIEIPLQLPNRIQSQPTELTQLVLNRALRSWHLFNAANVAIKVQPCQIPCATHPTDPAKIAGTLTYTPDYNAAILAVKTCSRMADRDPFRAPLVRIAF
jgi:hypothetical protein